MELPLTRSKPSSVCESVTSSALPPKSSTKLLSVLLSLMRSEPSEVSKLLCDTPWPVLLRSITVAFVLLIRLSSLKLLSPAWTLSSSKATVSAAKTAGVDDVWSCSKGSADSKIRSSSFSSWTRVFFSAKRGCHIGLILFLLIHFSKGHDMPGV